MCFGQRIGPLLFDRILRGDREKRLGQPVGGLADRHIPFLHRLQQGGLRFGRGAVDFIGQQDVCEDGAFDKPESAPAMFVFIQHIGAGDVRRHQVGGELDAFEVQVENPGQCADHQRFGQAGHPFQQAVPPSKDGGEQLFDHLILPDDDFLQLLLHDEPMLAKFLEDVAQIACFCRQRFFLHPRAPYPWGTAFCSRAIYCSGCGIPRMHEAVAAHSARRSSGQATPAFVRSGRTRFDGLLFYRPPGDGTMQRTVVPGTADEADSGNVPAVENVASQAAYRPGSASGYVTTGTY